MPSLPLGLTWTELTAASALGIQKTIWAGDAGVFVQVGTRSGNVGSGGNATRIRWSSDGVTWHEVSDSGLAYNWTGVAYAPIASGLGTGSGRLCAVTSTTLETLGATPTKQIITSDDGGATWTSRTSPEINQWQDIVWAAGLSKFVAVAQTGTNRVMYSSDGITWNVAAAAAVKSWNAIAWDPGAAKLVATAGTTSTTSIMTSTNATAWTGQTSASFNFTRRSLIWSPLLSLFIISSSTNHIVTSPDGVTWTDQGAQSFRNQIVDASSLGAVIMSGGSPGGTYLQVLETTNATAWTAENTDPGNVFSSGTLDAIAFSPTLGLVVITYNGTNTHIITGASAVAPSVLTAAGDSTAAFVPAWPEFHIAGLASTSFVTGLTVYSVTPDEGYTRGGGTIVIAGAGFEIGCTVQFGRYFGNFSDASDVVRISSTVIHCTLPPHTPDEVVSVVVTNPSTEYAALELGFTYLVTSFVPGDAGSFTITPSVGPISGGTLVTIVGIGISLSPTAIVLFDGVPATAVTPVNDTTITCITPAHIRGVVDVKILNN
jgi:hypothetical protein